MVQLQQQTDVRTPAIGMVNSAAPLSVERQRALLEGAGCTFVYDVSTGAAAAGRVNDLLGRLVAGSDLFIAGIEAFNRSLPEALRILAGLSETGVRIHLVGADRIWVIEPTESAVAALRAVAAFAIADRNRSTSVGGRPPGGASLSKVQAKFARQLYDSGESLRTIGLICRASPDTVWAAIEGVRPGRR